MRTLYLIHTHPGPLKSMKQTPGYSVTTQFNSIFYFGTQLTQILSNLSDFAETKTKKKQQSNKISRSERTGVFLRWRYPVSELFSEKLR